MFTQSNRYPHRAEAELFIRSELSRHGILFQQTRNDFQLVCPMPGCSSSRDKFKLSVRKDGRAAQCWVCHWKGTWNTLAPSLGAAPFNSSAYGFSDGALQNDFFKQLSSQMEESQKEVTPELPEHELDVWNGAFGDGKPWRGLSIEFLRGLPAFAWHQHTKWGKLVERILFPFYQNGQLLGYSGRRLDSDKFLRYDNAAFSSALKVLFPFDYVIKNFSPDRIVLVEGPIDALWMIQNGIPAFSILGTGNWSGHKRDLLIANNIKKVLICMDGDEAGRAVAPVIFNDLNTLLDKVECLSLPEMLDPATLSIDQLNWIKGYLGKI